MLLFLLEASAGITAEGPAKPATFVLNPKLIDQARRAAAVEMAKPRDLESRRPKGLENLDTPEEIAAAVEAAMNQMASTDLKTANQAYVQHGYLQDHAFSAIAAGAEPQGVRPVSQWVSQWVGSGSV